MDKPLVSVICLCFNQAKFVTAAINSVIEQDYQNVELIVVDDASTDGSRELIEKFLSDKPEVRTIFLRTNLGNCAAFNKGWQSANGKYIIDLAADDLLLPERLSRGVSALEEHGETYGVHYCDAQIIDDVGNQVTEHLTNELIHPVPEGIIFKELLGRYFINPVTMMIANKLIEDLKGYDESLSYEDFDLWVRSSKQYRYCYSPEILVAKRKLPGSHSSGQYRFKSKMLGSTFRVCQKAYKLCETKDEFVALRKRVSYEMKKSFQSLNLNVGIEFFSLRRKISNRLKELS